MPIQMAEPISQYFELLEVIFNVMPKGAKCCFLREAIAVAEGIGLHTNNDRPLSASREGGMQ